MSWKSGVPSPWVPVTARPELGRTAGRERRAALPSAARLGASYVLGQQSPTGTLVPGATKAADAARSSYAGRRVALHRVAV